jgi:peroxiredoxin
MKGFARQLLVVSLVAAVSGLVGFYVSRHLPPGAEPPAPVEAAKPGDVEGQALPDARFNDLQGQPHALAEYRGRWLLLNFWASWCAPCMEEIPLLVQAQNQQGASGFRVLGIAMDEAAPVKAVVSKQGINYPVLAGNDDVLALMDKLGNSMGALPYSVLVSPDGVVRDLELGGLTTARLERWAKLAAVQ